MTDKFRCIDPFVHYPKGVEKLYGGGEEVEADDPILETHPAHFAPMEAVTRTFSPVRTETATAAPGEYRTVATPPVKRGRQAKQSVKPDPEPAAEPVAEPESED